MRLLVEEASWKVLKRSEKKNCWVEERQTWWPRLVNGRQGSFVTHR
jgi:hypothetical protein